MSEQVIDPELVALFEKGDAETLRRYWTEGKGAADIRWGEDGDFMRCVRKLSKYVTDPKGYCSDMHVRATGARPGHAASEQEPTMPQAQRLAVHETVSLVERASAATDGRWPVRVISAGWGSSGYYSPKVLERAAANQLVKAGTPLFFDHPSKSARTDRPERSVRDIAAVFTGPATYNPSTRALEGDVQVFRPYRELVAEMAPHIGLSIDGSATDITEGEADGRRGPLVEDLFAINSVDLVTRAGRGGQFMALYEAAREHMDADVIASEAPNTNVPAPAGDPSTESQQETPMGQIQIEESEHTRLTEAAGRVETLETERDKAIRERDEALAQVAAKAPAIPKPTSEAAPKNPREVMERQIAEQGREIALMKAGTRARDVVAEVLSTGWIGDAQRVRLVSSLVADLPLTEAGALDEEALRDRAQRGLEEAETEAAEILSAAGVGTPRGLGALTTPATEVAGKQFEDELRESFLQAGLSDAAADLAVKGR